MRTKRLGKNGPELSIIGFGAWAIGGPWEYGWGPVDDESSKKAIRKALDLGINWIDTAAVYGLGHSEEVVSEAIKGKRHDVFIATKCGLVWDDRKRVTRSIKPDSIRREIEASLHRLNTDYIDLYQIHWYDEVTPVEDAWGMMSKLQEEGKTRYIGVSNFGVDLLKKCQSIAPVQSLQPPYNLIKREIEKEILPYCFQNEIGVVAYSPMMSGLLSGKFDAKLMAPDDWRRKDKMFQEPMLSRALALVERLAPIASRHGKTVGQLAIAWVNANPAITSAIVGARTPEQVQENVGAADLILSESEMIEIEKILKETLG